MDVPRMSGRLLATALLFSLAACGQDGEPRERVDGKHRAAWMAQLEGTPPAEQAEALRALGRFESPPLDSIAAFLDKRGRTVRVAAIEALGHAGPEAVAYAERLADRLERDREGDDAATAKAVRDAAMVALGRMGPAAFKPIAHLLVSEDARHRLRAVFVLRAFAAEMEGGTQTLLPLLQDEDANVRREAIRALGVAGKGQTQAAKALMNALEDPDLRVAAAAAMALGGIGGRADVEGKALADRVHSHQSALRAAAIYGLGLMGEEASPYAGRIADVMRNDGHQDLRVQAARAYYRVLGDAQAALPVLQAALADTDARVCREALRALCEIGPAARPTLPALEEARARLSRHPTLGPALEETVAAVSEP